MLRRNRAISFPWFAAGAAAALLLSAGGVRAADRDAAAAALNSITTDQLRRHVDVLADDTMEGRDAGSRGGRAAAGYIVSVLKRLTLKGAGSESQYFQSLPTGGQNVLALLPGGDPGLARQVIVVGAHFDHVGYGSGRTSYGPYGYIHNGADDNASGTSALLEIAEACTLLPAPPRRTILFAWWDGEEHGLLGSKHWISHPTVAKKNIALMLNADMIGRLRGEEVQILGTRTAPGLRELVARQNTERLLLDFQWDLKEDSDHWSFARAGVPAVMFHTGLHADYHRPSDDAERINGEGMRKVARLMLAVLLAACNADELPPFRPQAWNEATEEARRRAEAPVPPPPGRLGVTLKEPDPAGRAKHGGDGGGNAAAGDETKGADNSGSLSVGAGGGVELLEVRAGSAAERAGLKAGDRILRLGDRPIASPDDLIAAVLAAPAAVRVSVRRATGGTAEELTVELPGEPVRAGLAWRESDAEPGTVQVAQVIPGSPAARSGLRPGDRIHRVDGRPIVSGEKLRVALRRLPGPIELTIERRGRIETLTLHDLPPAG